MNHTIMQRYSLRRYLGAGASGSTWEAEDANKKKRVAIKMMSPRLRGPDLWPIATSHEASVLERFKDEGEQIIAFYAFYEEAKDRTAYIVQELAEHGTLADYMSSSPGAPDEEATRFIAAQLCLILGVLKRKNVVHMDLKAGNLAVVSKVSAGPVIKAIDFGLAKIIGDPSETFMDPVGTPGHMAPEVSMSEIMSMPYGPKVDVFSAATVIYERLTGNRLIPERFSEGGLMYSYTSLIEEKLRALRDQKGVSPAAIDFLVHTLDPDPVSRFSAEETLEHPWVRDLVLTIYPKAKAVQDTVKQFKFTCTGTGTGRSQTTGSQSESYKRSTTHLESRPECA
ncbi:kinase-like domain-containing protein [Vararia minispora EC-137]|uniref:Kinase-like domain-containing protein n=1 Tax=Vararia minispora EC-137 TaxID=1314806 RepID=A0ACB8QMC7_9AGAM|nr:kinase-like domain-containing protein [Vararia minispora EC-137]